MRRCVRNSGSFAGESRFDDTFIEVGERRTKVDFKAVSGAVLITVCRRLITLLPKRYKPPNTAVSGWGSAVNNFPESGALI